MKKLASCIVICMLLVFCVLPAAFAEELASPKETASGSYRFILQDDGTAMITRYTGQKTALELPAELDGYRVTAVGESAFQANRRAVLL